MLFWQVGPTYGQKMMKGYLQTKGIKVSESTVAKSLKRVAPESYQSRRQNTLDRRNPVQYAALYFGHKLHIDQNEKLKMYGVTHVVARDGFSGKIVSFVTMPIKSNTVIYDAIYR